MPSINMGASSVGQALAVTAECREGLKTSTTALSKALRATTPTAPAGATIDCY